MEGTVRAQFLEIESPSTSRPVVVRRPQQGRETYTAVGDRWRTVSPTEVGHDSWKPYRSHPPGVGGTTGERVAHLSLTSRVLGPGGASAETTTVYLVGPCHDGRVRNHGRTQTSGSSPMYTGNFTPRRTEEHVVPVESSPRRSTRSRPVESRDGTLTTPRRHWTRREHRTRPRLPTRGPVRSSCPPLTDDLWFRSLTPPPPGGGRSPQRVPGACLGCGGIGPGRSRGS